MSKIGAHVSSASSVDLSFDRAQAIGADCFQIFISPPQQWSQTLHKDEAVEKFLDKAKTTQIGPNFIHGTYLVNLGSANTEHVRKSIEWLTYSLQAGSRLKMAGTIFHLGSHKGAGFEQIAPQVIDSLKKVLDQAPQDVQLILETSAGSGGNIGGKFEELGMLLKGVEDQRLKICLDTQHVFAAGYDVKSVDGLSQVLASFDQHIGLGNLVAIHANDSKSAFGSGRDRHENIGAGSIGTDGFYNILNHQSLAEVPFILEVPGFADHGPDQPNITILKSLLMS